MNQKRTVVCLLVAMCIGLFVVVMDAPTTANETKNQSEQSRACTVHYRADVGDSNFNLPGSLPGNWQRSGDVVTFTAKFVRADDGWLVVNIQSTDFWIPRERVLLLKMKPVD